jgi:hypothetical protein
MYSNLLKRSRISFLVFQFGFYIFAGAIQVEAIHELPLQVDEKFLGSNILHISHIFGEMLWPRLCL